MNASNGLLQVNEKTNIFEHIKTENGKKFHHDRSSVHSGESGAHYRICDSETLPTNYIKLNGKVRKAIKIIRIVDGYNFFNLFKMDFDNVIEDFLNKNKAKETWAKFKKEYLDNKNWINEINSISEGYENMYDDELTEIYDDAIFFANELRNEFYYYLDDKYFKNEKSQIQDLSIVNGVKTFELSNLVFNELEDEFLLEEKLGGKFWIDDKEL